MIEVKVMKRKMKFIFPVLLLSMALTGCDFITINDPTGEGGGSGSGTSQKTLDKYYDGYDLNKKGDRLTLELQKNCWEKHTEWVTYGQVNNYFGKTSSHDSAEAIKSGSTTNQWFYTGKEQAGYGTREHVWPCASSSQLWTHTSGSGIYYVDYTYYVGGGSDLYHIRTCNSVVNTARGDSKFVEFSDPEMEEYRSDVAQIGENGGKYQLKIQGYSTTESGVKQFAKRAEPADGMKGDVARIILYVWLHYKDRGYTPTGSKTSGKYTYEYKDMMSATMNLTNIMGYDSEERCLEVLNRWNEVDPPSDVEKLRNNTVQKVQGNRNPFVDYPELVARIINA